MDPVTPILWLPVFTAGEEDRANLLNGLAAIRRTDPCVIVRIDPQTDDLLVSGTSVEHLQLTFDSVTDGYRIPAWQGEPRVRYLETIRQTATGEGKYIRQIGGSGNYGHVKLRLEPTERGTGFSFQNAIEGDVIPEQFIRPIEVGVREAAQAGILGGCELVDFRATLFDGSYHEIDSNALAFQTAASLAFKETAGRANPVLLEPVMSVEFLLPEIGREEMIADLRSRRSQITEVEISDADYVRVSAIITLAEVLRCAPAPQKQSFLYWQEKSFPDSSDNAAGAPVLRPRSPAPKTRGSEVDPDWT